MRRKYLQLYDKSSGGGTVIDGMEDVFNENTALTFLGARVVCPTCKTTGTIVPRGPRWPNDWMGKQMALEDDVCICKCSPPPVMIASQDKMFDEFQVHELAEMGFGPTGLPLQTAKQTHAQRYDRRAQIVDEATGRPLAHVRYRLVGQTGSIEGRTDEQGMTGLLSGATSETVRLEIFGD
jgi:uncharacterized Zn-binding protein involved in type VI secretion